MMTAKAGEEILVLAGQGSVHDFMDFVRTRSIDSYTFDELTLIREWRRARAFLDSLETRPSESVSGDALQELPGNLVAEADAALEDVATRKSLSFLPYRWAMVELDRLIVWQPYVNLAFATAMRQSLPALPTDSDLLRVSIGADHGTPPVHVSTLTSSSFAFSSSSSDMRVLAALPIDPANVRGHQPYGHAAVVLAVYIGYGVNVVSAVQMGDRIMLINGTHRAYALRAHGVTHIPCVVSQVESRADLELAGIPEYGTSVSYFSAARPPLLKDYFDERLFKRITAPSTRHVIQLDLEFDRARIAAHP